MAESLKSKFGPEVPRRLAEVLEALFPQFPAKAFLTQALAGYETLELMPRAHHLATALRDHLPPDYPTAIEILLRSLGPKLNLTEGNGMAPFFYLPHAFFIARFGLEHFEVSMRAQYELTQRFTAEFSIRPFIERYPEATFKLLKTWAKDPSVHVRRLVSEGTRPRLPWAPRLRSLQKDPSPSLPLLELLKDDEDLYVRRSVANHLNDIGKDHPDLLVQIAKKWTAGASQNRLWILKHSLRSLIKQGNQAALEVFGFRKNDEAMVSEARLSPSKVQIGNSVSLSFKISNPTKSSLNLLVDFRIFFVKSNSKPSPKVFKLKTFVLAPGEEIFLSKKISLSEMTTRKHYTGIHRVDILVNGTPIPAGSFTLI